MRKLRIVFMGTPEFAVASLDALLHSEHEVVAVVTVADKPAGRGKQLSMSAVKQYALEKNLPILQPEKLRNEEFLNTLRSYNADLFVVVAFRMLPEVVWSMPPLGSINLHGSLLPAYRGAAPINWAIINGEKQTGVTIFFLQHEIDTGRVIRRETIEIGENETAGELHDKMMVIGAKALVSAINDVASGKDNAISQDELVAQGETVKHAPKIFKEDCKIDFTKSVDEIHNFVRGLAPYPAAWTYLGDKTLKVYMGEKQPGATGEEPYLTDGKTYLKFKCSDGYYSLKELQLEGKKRMGIEEFLRGWRA
ncbi:MAG TPA: methionyl-tRNA formyltransferase [Flavobacteriales bacterium]